MVVRRGVSIMTILALISMAGCVGPGGDSLGFGGNAILKLEEFVAPEGPIVLGNVARMEFTVVNEGDEDGSFAIQLLVDGEVHMEKTFRVLAGAKESSSFEFEPSSPGEYVVELVASVVGEGATEVYAGPKTIVVEMGALLMPSRLQLSATEAPVGEEVTAIVTMENKGAQRGEVTIPLKLDGETIREGTIELDGGQSGTLDFTFTSEARGWRSVSVPGLEPQNVEFYLPALFEIANLQVNDDTPDQGRDFTYSFTIRNIGDREGSTSYVISLDGQPIRSETVKVSGSADTQVTGTTKPTRSGPMELTIDVQDDLESFPLTVLGPNLVVEVTKHPHNSDYSCYDEAFVSFTVSNHGQGPADAVKIELLIDGSPTSITYGSWRGSQLTKDIDARLGEVGPGSSVSYEDLKFHVVDYCWEPDTYDLIIKLTSEQGVFQSQSLRFTV